MTPGATHRRLGRCVPGDRQAGMLEAMNGPRRTLKRIEEPGHGRFLTFSCYRRLPLLGNDRVKDAFVQELGRTRRDLGFRLYAWVVMPEHVHLLLRTAPPPPESGEGWHLGHADHGTTAHTAQSGEVWHPTGGPGGSGVTVREILTRLKSAFAQRVLGRWRELDAAVLPRLRDKAGRSRFWQPGGGYDRNLVSVRRCVAAAQYIHHNPVRRGLVDVATDYPWSSARGWAGRETSGLRPDPLE